MRKIAAISAGRAIGVVATMVLASITRHVRSANDSAYQCANRYLNTGAFVIGDKPMLEGVAAVIARQCKEALVVISAITSSLLIYETRGRVRV